MAADGDGVTSVGTDLDDVGVSGLYWHEVDVNWVLSIVSASGLEGVVEGLLAVVAA